MPYTPYQLSEMFRKLPADVREAQGSIEYEKTMEEIENKFHLHVDQAGALSNEVFLLMLGLTHPEEFVGKVEKSIKVSSEIAEQISKEVNEKIFRPIRTSLMKIHKMIDEKEMQEEEGDEGGENESAGDEGFGVETKVEEAKQEELPEKKAEEVKLESKKTNIAEEKLKKTFTIPKKESGYVGKDPYHEEVV